MVVLPFVYMALIAPTMQTVFDNKAFKGLVGNLSERAIDEIENQIDDLIDEPLSEETVEMIEAFREVEEISEEKLQKALRETASRLSDQDIVKIENLLNALKKLKGEKNE